MKWSFQIARIFGIPIRIHATFFLLLLFVAIVHANEGGPGIVRGADFADEIGIAPESAGLRAISAGFPLVAADDDETLERASFLYDALYASLREMGGDAISGRFRRPTR